VPFQRREYFQRHAMLGAMQNKKKQSPQDVIPPLPSIHNTSDSNAVKSFPFPSMFPQNSTLDVSSTCVVLKEVLADHVNNR
jgi:hypothetical protein